MSNSKTAGLTEPSDWFMPFMELRRRVRPLVEREVKLRHAVFLSGLGKGKDLSHIVEELDPSYELPLLEEVIIPAGEGVWAHHCFFAENSIGLDALSEATKGLDRSFKELPKEIRPRPDAPVGIRDRSLSSWLGVIYNLGWGYEEEGLWADLEYSDFEVCGDRESDEIRLLPWSEYPGSVFCDPTPLITLTPLQDRTVEQWQPIGESNGVKFPNLVAAYLDQDLLVASVNAVMPLKYYAVPPKAIRPTVLIDSSSLGRKVASKKRSRKESPNKLKIFSMMCLHHGCRTTAPNFSPLGKTEQEFADACCRIAEEPKYVLQPAVSLRLPEIIPGGLPAYLGLCKRETVTRYLEASEWRRKREGWLGGLDPEDEGSWESWSDDE